MAARRVVHFLLCFPCAALLCLESQPAAMEIALSDFARRYAHTYDYVLQETAGLARRAEPVEVTLTVAGDPPGRWRDSIRVTRVLENGRGALVPHQTLGEVTAGGVAEPDGDTPHPAASINVVFLADCPAGETVTYRLHWGVPDGGEAPAAIPAAAITDGLDIAGEAPGLTVANEFYRMALDPRSGAIQRILPAKQGEDMELFYRNIPIHFGVDIWSPPQPWDHDYDWPAPPNHALEGGPLALRYRRWGPLHNYRDVEVSITYTFYARNPHVHVSSTMRLTRARSAHAIRMGEIVVSHSRRPPGSPDGGEPESPELFTHYAWRAGDTAPVSREINAFRSVAGEAAVAGFTPGGLAVLDRDAVWVAGYNAALGFGLATVRLNQFAGNYLGGETPQSAPCTYLGQYGWGFVYWSRPMVYPLGALNSPLDLNTAVAAGAIFGTEEMLVVYEPDAAHEKLDAAARRMRNPLRLDFRGTGPW
ncbi:MAG: hypothetical protein KF886_08475 [Candidatus Hydrogenedentes bacterium]|nr:hypothetical protein [Candidatus Hydrogenedentota bacterium]